MRRLILTTASVIALGVGLTFAGTAPANAWTHQSAMHGRMTHVSSADISDIQQKLQADNLYSGKIDGKMGPQTRRALAEFQKQNGLRLTANLDRQTRDSLLGTTGTATPPAQPAGQMIPPPNQARPAAPPPPSSGTSATGR